MDLFKPITLSNWAGIRERYKDQMLDVEGDRLIELDIADIEWLEQQLLQDVENFVDKPLRIKTAIIFGQSASNVQGTHVDGFARKRYGASNWALNIPVFNCDQGEMIWYAGDYILKPATNTSKIGYQRIIWITPTSPAASKIIDAPTIVKVDVPHQVINHSDQRRVMLSVRFTPDLF